MMQRDVYEQKRALVQRIQTEGAEAAYEAALEVCRDHKAPAPARATCATTILRAGGYLNPKQEEDRPKEPHEMSAEELNAAVAEVRAELRRAELRRADPSSHNSDDVEDGAFG